MIRSFKHKGLQKIFTDGTSKKIQPKHTDRIEMILDLLNAAHTKNDMNFPGSNLHLLQPKQAKRWAVDVSGNWRIVFTFKNGDASDVDYIDYH